MTTPTPPDLLAHLTGTAAPAPAPALDLEAMLAKLPPDQAALVRATLATAPAQAAQAVPMPAPEPEPVLDGAELKAREDEAVAAGKVKRTRKAKEQSDTKEAPECIYPSRRRDARLDVVIACIHSNRTPEDATAFLDLVGDA